MAGWPTWLQQLTPILNLQSNIRKYGCFRYDLDPFFACHQNIFLVVKKKILLFYVKGLINIFINAANYY